MSAIRQRPVARVRAYASMSLKARLADRGNAMLHGLSDLVTTTIGLVIVTTIYHRVPDVRGWTSSEAVLAWGFGEASLGVFLVVFHGLHAMNPRYIVGGELDRVLLRPLDPYAQILLDHVRPQAAGVALLGLIAIFVAAGRSPVVWTPVHWVLLPVFVVSGALVVGGILTAVCALGFWMHHQGTAIGLAYQIAAFGRYPRDFLPRAIGWAVTAVPFAFAGFIPATFYMDRPEWWSWAVVQPAVGLGCMTLGYAFWRFSLRRYASAGT